MANVQYYDVILKPVVTESSMQKMSEQVVRYKKETVEINGKKTTKSVKDSKGKFERETAEIRKYTFLVHPEATKTQIKDAVEKMFEGVEVAKVNTMNYKGKEKRRGKTVGKTARRKKAIITLKENSKDIELFGNN